MFAASLRARLLSGAHGAGSPVAEPSVSGVLFIDYTAPAAEAEAGAARPPPLRYSVDKRHTSLFQSCRPAAGRAPAAGRCGAATTALIKDAGDAASSLAKTDTGRVGPVNRAAPLPSPGYLLLPPQPGWGGRQRFRVSSGAVAARRGGNATSRWMAREAFLSFSFSPAA